VTRKTYLEDIPLEDALSRFLAALEPLYPLPEEIVPLARARGRVNAGPIWAKTSSPHYHAAAMDGVAVKAADTVGASKTSPIRLKMDTQAHWIDTGGAMPQGFNAVVMIEDVQTIGEDEIEIMAAVAPWQHVRALGEDIIASELVLAENTLIRSQEVGALATSGLTEVPVRRKPKVGIIPTGSEIITPGSELEPGKIIEFNSLMLAGLVEDWGGNPKRYPIVPDDFQKIKRAAEKALRECDIVIVNAGSSAGRKDFTAPVFEKLGKLIVHGIAIRPGHPVVLGVAQGKPLIGIPGYPVSAVFTTELLVKPIVHRLLGTVPAGLPRIEATVTRKILSPMGQDEFVRVTMGRVGDRIMATPLARGAGVIMSLVRADGILRIPRFSEGIDAGSPAEVELLRPIEEIETTIVAIGSHDLSLDLLSSLLRKAHPGRRLSSAHVGSLGGLVALKRVEAHLAGSHLLDEETGDYNVSYIKKTLGGQPIVLMNLVYRDQGLMVAKGNPKHIVGLKDLVRKDATFINRQRGSGTRVLLDYELKRAGLDASKINGYEREEFTHTSVAAMIASGAVDVGLGVLAAARALGIDFVPLMKERYDLVIPQPYYESALLEPLLAIIRGKEFQETVFGLGGYDISETGKVLAIIS